MTQTSKYTRTALITGAARRIGRAIAEHLHQHGYRVIIHYHRSSQQAKNLEKALNQIQPQSALALCADLTSKAEAYQLVKQSSAWASRLDVLVNNASIFKRTDFAALDESDWDSIFTTNVKAPFWLSHAAYPMLAKQHGCIINITDIHAEKPLKHYAIYCQSKAALTMQTKALAREFAPSVRVNAVAPGSIAWPEGQNTLDETIKQQIIAHTPLDHHGNPLYIAQAVLSLVENTFITGETLRVDGGRGLT